MTNNLTLNGTNNYIDVGNGGSLLLEQSINAAGQQNQRGGIVLGPAFTQSVTVQVESGGTLSRFSIATSGVPNQVRVGGAVYNLGGTVDVSNQGMLNITGTDANGYSYWQKSAGTGLLFVHQQANLNAAGKYEIDSGTVKLTAIAMGSADRLDGAGLIFGNANPTYLTIVDAAMPGGKVTIQGPVTLAQNTTTTTNFLGSNNTADLLDVQNGALTLNDTLSLQSVDGQKPTNPLNFLDDSGNAPSIAGAFASIKDNVGGTDTGRVIVGMNVDYFQVTIR